MNAPEISNDLEMATGERISKAYATLAAQYAPHGMELVKGDPEIVKEAPYFVTRPGLWKPLESLDAAHAYMAQLPARGHGQSLQAQ